MSKSLSQTQYSFYEISDNKYHIIYQNIKQKYIWHSNQEDWSLILIILMLSLILAYRKTHQGRVNPTIVVDSSLPPLYVRTLKVLFNIIHVILLFEQFFLNMISVK